MEIPGITIIKKEMAHLTDKELISLLIDLSKFNPDNKKFLFFKLFEKEQSSLFLEFVQEELTKEFITANTRHYHYAKKSAQKIRRVLNRYLKFTKDKASQVDLILFFCEMMEKYNYLQFHHPVIENLFKSQIGKAEKLIIQLHADLQYDYQEKIEKLKGLS